MAKIDLKNSPLTLWDGTLGTLTTTAAATNDGQVQLDVLSKHIGTNKISLTLVDPGEAGSLSVVVTGRAIVVTLAWATSAVTTTATLLAALLTADADVAALCTAVVDPLGDGSGLVDAQAITTLDGQKSITITVGEGTLTYSEKAPREFVKDRGNLDTVRNADQEPVDVSLDFVWDFLTSESGGSTPTIEEVLKRTGVALSETWLTTSTDICQPYCIDIEVANTPVCSSVANEYTMFEEFYYETLDHDIKEGSVACSGRSNRTVAVHSRAL